jgi:hypothetical protein
METPSQRAHVATSSVIALMASIGLLLLLTACGVANGAGTVPTFPAAPPSQVTIVSHSATVAAQEGGNYHLAASASCKPGEQLLGGGYILSDVWESDYSLEANYPANTSTWTVRANSGSHYDLEALVYCVQAYPDLGLQVLQAVECPTGSAMLSSGTQGSTPLALCASHYVMSGTTPHSFRLGAVVVQCQTSSTGNNLSETRSFSYTCTWR